MKIIVINGPNLNMLGIREPDIYGKQTYTELENYIKDCAAELGAEVKIIQTNHEGAIIDQIQNAYFEKFDGIVINPAGYTHTSIAIFDALKATSIPTVEVHISDITKRESFRAKSFIAPACITSIVGKGFAGYKEAITALVNLHRKS